MKNSETARLPINQPERYDLLSVEAKAALQKWIAETITSNEKHMLKYDSYILKHLYYPYIDNGAFKGAMLAAEYIVEDTRRINWKFKKGEN